MCCVVGIVSIVGIVTDVGTVSVSVGGAGGGVGGVDGNGGVVVGDGCGMVGGDVRVMVMVVWVVAVVEVASESDTTNHVLAQERDRFSLWKRLKYRQRIRFVPHHNATFHSHESGEHIPTM